MARQKHERDTGMAISLERLAPDALHDMVGDLARAGLPVDDIHSSDAQFYRASRGDQLIGFVGLEGGGPDRLLRSLVVVPEHRGAGAGADILGALETKAADDGTSTLHLLTTTAERFFLAHGYRSAERDAAPASISSTTEFSSLCPASAVYLTKRLPGQET